MTFGSIPPGVDEYTNPITGATYKRGPNNVWTQIDDYNKVEINDLVDGLDDRYVNITGDNMTGTLLLDEDLIFKCDPVANNLGPQYVRVRGTQEYGNRLVFTSHPMNDTHTNGYPNTHIEIGESAGEPFTILRKLPTPTTGDQAVSKDYLEHEISNIDLGDLSGFLPLTGGAVSGLLKLTRDSGFGLELKPGNTAKTGSWSANGSIRVYPSATLVDTNIMLGVYKKGNDNDLSFKVNADGKVKAGKDPNHPFIATEDNDLTTKKYVDDARELLPPGLKFTYNDGSVPNAGEFTLMSSTLTLSHKAYMGFEWMQDTTGFYGGINYSDKAWCTIWYRQTDGNWNMKTRMLLVSETWSNNYVEFGCANVPNIGFFTAGRQYYITIAGLI